MKYFAVWGGGWREFTGNNLLTQLSFDTLVVAEGANGGEPMEAFDE